MTITLWWGIKLGMTPKLFEYKNCDTCKKAIKFLKENKIDFQDIPIVENPPSVSELKRMLEFLKKDGETFKKLFNTSGVLYRELKISQKLEKGLTESDAIKLLSENGKLVKRPFMLLADTGMVGFKSEDWARKLKIKK